MCKSSFDKETLHDQLPIVSDPRGFVAKMAFLRAEGTGNSFGYLRVAAAHRL